MHKVPNNGWTGYRAAFQMHNKESQLKRNAFRIHEKVTYLGKKEMQL